MGTDLSLHYIRELSSFKIAISWMRIRLAEDKRQNGSNCWPDCSIGNPYCNRLFSGHKCAGRVHRGMCCLGHQGLYVALAADVLLTRGTIITSACVDAELSAFIESIESIGSLPAIRHPHIVTQSPTCLPYSSNTINAFSLINHFHTFTPF